MPSFFNKLASRWNNNSNSPKYGPIGPIAPKDVRTPWRQRLARLLGSGQTLPLRTASYRPVHQAWFHQPRDLPPFTFQTINSMLLDPGIRLNLAMRAAPIYGLQFAYPNGTDAAGKVIYQPGIQARNPAVAAWVARQLATIWHNDRYCPVGQYLTIYQQFSAHKSMAGLVVKSLCDSPITASSKSIVWSLVILAMSACSWVKAAALA